MQREKEGSKGIRFFIVFFFIAIFFFIVGFIANRWFFSKDAAKATLPALGKEAAIKKTDSDKNADDVKKRNPIVGEEKEELTFYKTLQNGKEPPPLKAQKQEGKGQKGDKTEDSVQKKEEKEKKAEEKGQKTEEKKQKTDNKENKSEVKKQEAVAKDKKTGNAKEKIAKRNIKSESQAKEKRFTLQIAAFKDKDKAEDVAGSLKKKGFEPYIVPVTIPDKGVWYRVRIGRFATRPDAQNIQAKLKKSEGINAFITFTTE